MTTRKAKRPRQELAVLNGMPGGTPGAQMRRTRRDGWTKKRREAFISALAETANVRLSCERVKLSTATAYELRRRDPEFAAAWQNALAEGVRQLEMKLLERAINGDLKPVFHSGKQCGEVREYPDRVAMFLISRHGGGEGAAAGGENEPGSLKQLRARQAREAKLREKLVAEIESAAERLRDDE